MRLTKEQITAAEQAGRGIKFLEPYLEAIAPHLQYTQHFDLRFDRQEGDDQLYKPVAEEIEP